MGKGQYLGGSSVVGFLGSFTGKTRSKLSQASDIDAHLTQKDARNKARAAATRPKRAKKSKANSGDIAKKESRLETTSQPPAPRKSALGRKIIRLSKQLAQKHVSVAHLNTEIETIELELAKLKAEYKGK